MARFAYGGQALMEGVLMRGRDSIAVAIRHPDGHIVWKAEALDSVLHRNRFARAPFFRGLVVLYETLVVGMRWLMRSGSIAAASEGVEMGRRSMAVMFALTIAFAIGLFTLLPLFLSRGVAQITVGPNQFLIEQVYEAFIQIGIFMGYLLLVGQTADIRRVFQYHGAEHMTIHALEHDDPLTIDEIRKYPTAHPRCGTEFLVVFIILNIIFFSFLAGQPLLISIVGRLLMVPLIASVAYELLRLGARYRANPVVRAVFAPGMAVQKITTKQPDDTMIEVAIASMQEALRANGETAPEGSTEPERQPLEDIAGPEPSHALQQAPGEVPAAASTVDLTER
ncbi:MAG: DUF1385 domain-containing protein [Chloroflexi bacterium]|nr:DUF1385 domain-containing protein [Chloroflexota bacterium]